MPEPQRNDDIPHDIPGGLRFDSLPLTGFGPTLASTGPALAWFGGHLYLSPAGVTGDPARIFRRDGATGHWTAVYESPQVESPIGLAPRETGIRAMIVFQGSADRMPCLYCGTISGTGGQILRSENGVTFAPAPPLAFGAPALGGFVPFGPWLAALPTGQGGAELHLDRAARGTVPQVAQDPAAGFWTPADELARSTGWHADSANLAVAALAVAHGALYAATTNPTKGFELWRTRGETTAPFQWEKVLERGAWRFAENPSVAAMACFDGDLWIGTEGQSSDDPGDGGQSTPAMAAAGLRDRIAARLSGQKTAAAAAELICIRADGSWDIIVGAPRFTPAGLKVPLSAKGPGFGDIMQVAISALAVQGGRLYAGTRQRRPRDNATVPGAALWSSADGLDWTLLAAAEQANEADCVAIDILCPTPEGLFVGLRRDVTTSLSGWAGASTPAAQAEVLADELVLLRGFSHGL